MEKSYTVAQTVKMTGVKSYVLRYWEEELDLKIGRNEMGHRCYTGYDIQLFLNIKELKKRGLQLRAIKEALPRLAGAETGNGKSTPGEASVHLPEAICMAEGELLEKSCDMEENIPEKFCTGKDNQAGEAHPVREKLNPEDSPAKKASALEKNNKRKEDIDLLPVDSEEQIKKAPSGLETKEDTEKIVEFQEILERLIAQELHAKNEGEDRWRTLDEAIRRQQMARKEAAAASDKKGKKNSKINKTCK